MDVRGKDGDGNGYCAPKKNTERIAVTRWTEVKIDERRNAGSLRGNRERYVPH